MARRLLLLTLTALLLLSPPGCEPKKADVIDVTIAQRTFKLELALDQAARNKGLSDRDSIAADGGMLFAFARAQRLSFWMRHCLVPIDIIFLGPKGDIVSMHHMTVEPYDTPESDLKGYDSVWPAQFAIELRGGMLDQLDLKAGQRIQLPVEDLKQRAR